VVGSAALDAFRPDRSDIDFVAVADGPLDLRRVRLVHWLANALPALGQVARLRIPIPGTVNGVYLSKEDLTQPVTEIKPLASHSGSTFRKGAAFDVNPPMWKLFHDHGIPLRGPAPPELDLDPEPDKLREWNLDNLHGFWLRTGRALENGKRVRRPQRLVLGVLRLHYTISTGGIASKEQAGEHGLQVFGQEWHPLIESSLAYWRGQKTECDNEQTGRFLTTVVADAEQRYGMP
jgi:hypothetical protein